MTPEMPSVWSLSPWLTTSPRSPHASCQHVLIEHLTRTLELHGWQLAWGERGLVVSHGDNDLTLGISEVTRDYLTGGAA